MTVWSTENMTGPIEDRTSPFEPEPQAKMPNKSDALTQSPCENKLYTIAVPNVASDTQHRIAQECVNIARYLLEKNQQYGSSMMMPGALFSKSTPLERVDVMVDTTLGQIGDEKLLEKKRSLIQKLIGWLVIRQLATDDQMGDLKDGL